MNSDGSANYKPGDRIICIAVPSAKDAPLVGQIFTVRRVTQDYYNEDKYIYVSNNPNVGYFYPHEVAPATGLTKILRYKSLQ